MSSTLRNRPSGTMNGGRERAEMLLLAGAGPMFGMGGFQLLPFYDAIGPVGLNHHLINDERCGAFAADAYARVTNRPRICDATLGPGATNLVTGLVESLNGGIPIAEIERAAKLIAKSKRPLLLTGGGIHLSEAWDALTRLAEAQSIPVAHTMSGKGGIACLSPLNAGLFGRYSRIANDLIEASDCLIVVGCKLGEIATKRFALPPPHIPVIHLDIVAEEIGRCIPAEIALWGDARAGLENPAEALADGAAAALAARAEYVGEVAPRMRKW